MDVGESVPYYLLSNDMDFINYARLLAIVSNSSYELLTKIDPVFVVHVTKLKVVNY